MSAQSAKHRVLFVPERRLQQRVEQTDGLPKLIERIAEWQVASPKRLPDRGIGEDNSPCRVEDQDTVRQNVERLHKSRAGPHRSVPENS